MSGAKLLDYSIFKLRRKKLFEILRAEYFSTKNWVFIIHSGFESERYTFRPSSSFYYLTGISEPATVLMIFSNGREILYYPQYSEKRAQWVGEGINKNQASLFGINEIKYLGDVNKDYIVKHPLAKETFCNLAKEIETVTSSGGTIYTLFYEDSRNGGLCEELALWVSGLDSSIQDVSNFVYELRKTKDDYEINLTHQAVQITNLAHCAIAVAIAPDKYEYQIKAMGEYIFSEMGARGPAFPSIIASGQNSTVLHYQACDNKLKEGDLVVVDIGAEYNFYSSDITRTYPVSGRFTTRQCEIYRAVLRVQEYIESIAQPGIALNDPKNTERSLHHIALKKFTEFGFGEYFSHGIGHFLGLDVHDVGSLDMPLEPGDLFTIEPGIYIPQENLGIRIEDNYVMADDGAMCLSYELPKKPEEIEKLMIPENKNI